ncbi:hypothetical protein Glove_100g15 [Diversispora epigaea]|uniref:BRCA2 OB1 domain-containing protein n=1 Tax=Diversispora epigaea TaxID=1348612 RepID=A0A397JED6_9GLOM|nr:hypothetical protein Glove_100g15 [Diversispora epigaea]
MDTFSTASGHRLNLVSKDSLERTRKKFEADFQENSLENNQRFSNANENDVTLNGANGSFGFDLFDSPIKSLGFSSANMKQLKHVSTESLMKARRSLGFDSEDNDKIFGDFTLEEKNELLSQQPNSKVTTERISYENCVTKNDYKMSKSPTTLSTLNFKKSTPKLKNQPHSKRVHESNFSNNIHPYTPLKTKKSRRILHPNLSNNLNSQSLQKSMDLDHPSPNKIQKIFDLTAPAKRYKLKDFVSNYPHKFSLSTLLKFDIPLEVIGMTPLLAASYCFTKSCDKKWENSTWGPNEAMFNLIECGADPNLIDKKWVYNHYQLIVWKIASLVRSFPHEFSNWWCAKKVLEQLKYRYEREINCAQRSVLKLIIEGDGDASWPMVLCVSGIYEESNSLDKTEEMSKIKYSLELTDSWYKIYAVIDQPLQRAILNSKIRIGYKLEICGAKIECKSTGIPVLEALSSKIRLKLSANSTKLANWDAKLGIRKFHPYALLRSLSPDGGFVHAIDIIIQRKYPLFFRETMKDGTVIVRNVKNEENERKEQEKRVNELIQSSINNFKESSDADGHVDVDAGEGDTVDGDFVVVDGDGDNLKKLNLKSLSLQGNCLFISKYYFLNAIEVRHHYFSKKKIHYRISKYYFR